MSQRRSAPTPLRPVPTRRRRFAAAALAALLSATALVAANTAGVRDYLDLARQRESRGCALSPPNSSAIGYYQMTLAALRDIGFKDDAGNWTENEWGITSDDEFRCHPVANDEAMKRFTERNWAMLADEVKDRIGRSAYGVVIDAASLLAGAHFLGARGMNDFVLCGMHVTCISEFAVLTNGGDPARIHRKLIERLKKATGLNVSELTEGS